MTDNMKKLAEEAEKDAAFAERLSALKTVEDLVALAKEKGYALTEEDLQSLTPAAGELADEALDEVAGGNPIALVWRGGSLLISKLPYTGGATFSKLGGDKKTVTTATKMGWTHI